MVERVIFHIGRRKTGTSSLQQWLTGNREHLLDEHAILYPTAGQSESGAHHVLARCLNPELDDPASVDEIVRDCLSEVPGNGAILFSSENFPRIPDMSLARDFVRKLGAKRVEAVCYVREHLDCAISDWREEVHSWRRKDSSFADYFACFLGPEERRGGITEFLERWSGLGDLQLGWYDRAILKNGDIVEDFFSRIGVEVENRSMEDVNPSIGGNLLVFRLIHNRYDVENGNRVFGMQPYEIRMADYFNYINLAKREKKFQDAFYIPDSVAARIRNSSEYNEVLFERLGPVELRGWEAETPLPDLSCLDRDIDFIGNSLNMDPDRRFVEMCRESAPLFEL